MILTETLSASWICRHGSRFGYLSSVSVLDRVLRVLFFYFRTLTVRDFDIFNGLVLLLIPIRELDFILLLFIYFSN